MKVLIWKKTGEEVKEGEIIHDFKGEKWVFISLTCLEKIWVRKEGSVMGNNGPEFNPQVFPDTHMLPADEVPTFKQ